MNMPDAGQPLGWARLQAGLTVETLQAAITSSGYPYQAIIADEFRELSSKADPHSELQEEWVYVDADSNQTRSVDLFAELPLTGREESATVRSFLNVLVECKQSEMPYVFFLRGIGPSRHYDYPEIGGLQHSEIIILPEQDGSIEVSFAASIHDFLGLENLNFFTLPCPFAVSISKAARKSGKNIELTGEEAYRALTLPLMKAADHLKFLSVPTNDNYFSCRIIICLAVLRAPMFGVYRDGGEDVLKALPWVRVCRLEPRSDVIYGTTSVVRYYDCVHEDYLGEI